MKSSHDMQCHESPHELEIQLEATIFVWHVTKD